MRIGKIEHLLLLSAALAVAGCSNVGSINGIRMNASTAPDATYCDANPEICVLGAAAIVGGGIALVGFRHHDAPIAAHQSVMN